MVIQTLNVGDLSLVGSLALGVTANDCDISTDGTKLAFIRASQVKIVDVATLTVSATFAVADTDSVCFVPGDNGHIYTCGNADRKIRKYTTAGALVTTYDLGFTGGSVFSVRAHPNSGYLFGFRNDSGSHIFCFDPATNTLLQDVPVSGVLNSFVFDPANTSAPFAVYAQTGSDVYKVDDTGTFIATPFDPNTYIGYDSLAIDSARQRIYTTAQNGASAFALVIESLPLP
jgi:hypothetical protein